MSTACVRKLKACRHMSALKSGTGVAAGAGETSTIKGTVVMGTAAERYMGGGTSSACAERRGFTALGRSQSRFQIG